MPKVTNVLTDVRAVLLSAGVSFSAIFMFMASLGFSIPGIGAGASILSNARQTGFRSL